MFLKITIFDILNLQPYANFLWKKGPTVSLGLTSQQTEKIVLQILIIRVLAFRVWKEAI